MEHVCPLVASPGMTSGFLGHKSMDEKDYFWVLPQRLPVFVWIPTQHCMLGRIPACKCFWLFCTLIPGWVWGLVWALSRVPLALLQCVRKDGGHVSEAQEVHVANGSGAPASPHFYSCSRSEPGRLPLVACGC